MITSKIIAQILFGKDYDKHLNDTERRAINKTNSNNEEEENKQHDTKIQREN